MTSEAFEALKSLIDHRVRITPLDGEAVIALLLYATTDLDGSRHLIYDSVQPLGSLPAPASDETFHSNGEDVLSVVLAT